MPVSPRVREIEGQIDGDIRALPIWRLPRQAVLQEIMQAYRDAVEVIFVSHLFFQTHPEHINDAAHDLGVLFAQEISWRAGTLWALKWAFEFCAENGGAASVTPEQITDLLALGTSYEAFVDALKRANQDLLEIYVDEGSRTLVCYEGDKASGLDLSIVEYQRVTTPTMHHVSLTYDDDQITSRWTAGDYRRVVGILAAHASNQENEICAGEGEPSVAQPTVVWLERPTQAPDRDVFDDLVLPADIASALKWKLVALLDSPIVQIGGRYCALSSDLKAIARIDDYMLRLAVRTDERTYTVAATIRESRMIAMCKAALEQDSRPWTTQSNVKFANPPQEADIVAKRDNDSLLIELKSTLRPETSWEVYKRNDDLLTGIRQAKALIERGIATRGFLLTDGYRGDYTCWAQALAQSIPIGTLEDLELVGSEPDKAVAILQARVGITPKPASQPERLPDREAELGIWKLRLVDGQMPCRSG